VGFGGELGGEGFPIAVFGRGRAGFEAHPLEGTEAKTMGGLEFGGIRREENTDAHGYCLATRKRAKRCDGWSRGAMTLTRTVSVTPLPSSMAASSCVKAGPEFHVARSAETSMV